MIGLVIVTHGQLAAELLHALEHVVGSQEAVAPIAIGPDDDIAARREQIIDTVAAMDQGQGVIVCTDMFGGTPSNLAMAVADQDQVEVIAGVNLPMLIKLATVRRTEPVAQAAASACDAARKYINRARDMGKDSSD